MYLTDDHIMHWVNHLKAGGVAIAPAEGQYGYVCDPFNEDALKKVMKLKQRDASKGLIVLAADISDLKYICPLLTGSIKQATKQHWWGACAPTTIILPAKENLSPLLTGGGDSIAVRRAFIPYMQGYLNAWKTISGHGLLVSTSCNISGQPPVIQAEKLPEHEDVPALTVENALSGKPSRIYDPTQDRFLR